jgi:sortase (surface protein transpeptidase)
MRPGDANARMNGHHVRLEHAPFTVHGRAMIGETTVARTFGSTVRYDAKHNRVAVRTPGVVVAGAADDEP